MRKQLRARHGELMQLAEAVKAPIVHTLRGKEFVELQEGSRDWMANNIYRRSPGGDVENTFTATLGGTSP